jgi:hypothetical protein
MAPRLDLQVLLEDLLGERKVYFQPPPSINMEYPCIVYKRDNVTTKFADNNPYKHFTRYQITVIDRNPDSSIPSLVADLPMCSFDRSFTADNLNHDVYNLFF